MSHPIKTPQKLGALYDDFSDYVNITCIVYINREYKANTQFWLEFNTYMSLIIAGDSD